MIGTREGEEPEGAITDFDDEKDTKTAAIII
jgi:hypothetical protein